MTKRIEQLMRRAEGALGRAFEQLDAAGTIAKKLDAEAAKLGGEHTFVELMIIREVIDRVGRISAMRLSLRMPGPPGRCPSLLETGLQE